MALPASCTMVNLSTSTFPVSGSTSTSDMQPAKAPPTPKQFDSFIHLQERGSVVEVSAGEWGLQLQLDEGGYDRFDFKGLPWSVPPSRPACGGDVTKWLLALTRIGNPRTIAGPQ